MSTFILSLLLGTALASDSAEHRSDAPEWAVDIHAAAESVWASNPEGAASAWDAQPGKTRAGFLRFSGPVVSDPALMPILAARLAQGHDTPEVRVALAESLWRTGGDWDWVAVRILAEEADPSVREVIVDTLRHASGDAVLSALETSGADDDPDVRAAAMRSLGRVEGGAAFSHIILDGLSDEATEVRGFAARSAGWMELDAAWELLTGLLTDPHPETRLKSLRALEDIDANRLSSLPQLVTLERDTDHRVARLATGCRTP